MIERDGRYLLCQRHPGPHLPLQWEFPGGKVEPGESPEAALEREIREELGAPCEVGARVADVTHHYPEKTVRIQFFSARLSGEPRPLIHRALSWAAPPDFDRFSAPPPNAVVLGRIRSGELETH